MFPLIPLAAQLLSFVAPKLGKWLGGDTGEEVASSVASIACRVAGVETPDQALDKLKTDPTLVLEMQRELNALENSLLEAETERLKAVNATMQAEYSAGDAYVRRWRPTWGYVTAAAWALQATCVMVATIGATIATYYGQAVLAKELLSGLSDLISSLTVQWTVALAVLGVNISARSGDKRASAGSVAGASGVVGAVVQRVLGP